MPSLLLIQFPEFGSHAAERAMPYVGLILFGGLMIGWLLLHLANRQDRKGWIFARAPRLPIRTLSVHDDAWIRGDMSCDRPLQCPWFDTACVWYAYSIEVKKTRTVRDSKGRTRTETYWATEHSESRWVDFDLQDEEASIPIRAEQLEIADSMDLGTDYEWGSRRHSAQTLPIGGVASILGVKMEEGDFGSYQEVPLLLTLRAPAEFIQGSDSKERWLRRFGYLMISIGGFAATAFYTQVGQPQSDWWLSGLAAVIFVLPFWFSSTYNRLVRRGQQVEAAWSQVDVDLAPRDRLIPDLAAVVAGYRDHERGLFTSLAGLRTGGSRQDRVANDEVAESVARRLLMLKEAYPELSANQLFLDYHDRLWVLEEKLAASRNLYNKVVNEWNDLVGSFPSLFVARLFGRRAQPFFTQSHGDDASAIDLADDA